MADYLAPITPAAAPRAGVANAATLIGAITAWTPGVKPTWTVSEVRSALRSHREGDFSQSALLVDTMGEDDAIPGLLEKYVDALLESDFELCPVTKDADDGDETPIPASEAIVEQLGDGWWDLVPEVELDEFLRWYRMLGVAVGVLEWDTSSVPWKARLKTLHPQFLRYEPVSEQFIYYAREGAFVVTPGDGKWVLLTDGRRGWMRAMVRQLGVSWLGKQLTHRDLLRFCERHGLPIVKAYAPAIADEGDKDDFWDQVRQLNSEIVAELPTNLDDQGAKFDLDLLEAKDQNWQVFLQSLDRYDRRFTIAFLGGNLSTEVTDQGSRAASDTHRGVERSKAQALGKRASTELRRQVLYPWGVFNVAGTTLDVVPWPRWATEPAEDLKGRAEGKKTLGDALVSVKTAGYRVKNLDEVTEPYGLDLEEQAAPPAPPPFPGRPGTPSATPAPPPPPGNRTGARAPARRLLASGGSMRRARGFVDGQLYADSLAEQGLRRSGPALQPTFEAIARVLEQATDYEDLRTRLHAMYADLDPDELTELVHQVMTLGELAGRAAVNQDT